MYVVGGRFDSDVDPFTDEDFDDDAEEIMESSQVSKLNMYVCSYVTAIVAYVCNIGSAIGNSRLLGNFVTIGIGRF